MTTWAYIFIYIYCKSKKFWLNLYRNLLYKIVQYFLDRHYPYTLRALSMVITFDLELQTKVTQCGHRGGGAHYKKILILTSTAQVETALGRPLKFKRPLKHLAGRVDKPRGIAIRISKWQKKVIYIYTHIP